jgi:methyl-accepting chemotaxis protein
VTPREAKRRLAAAFAAAAGVVAASAAAAQLGPLEEAGKRVASEGPLILVVAMLIVGVAVWLDWINRKAYRADVLALVTQHRAEVEAAAKTFRETIAKLEAARDAERARHELALAAALDRFISTLEKAGQSSAEVAAALAQLRLTIAEIVGEAEETQAAILLANAEVKSLFAQIGADMTSIREAKGRSAGR